jgi:TolB-like protein
LSSSTSSGSGARESGLAGARDALARVDRFERERGVRPAGARPDLSIAVLPFINRSRGEEDEYFSDGLADELLSVLSKVRGLRVAARASSFQFKGTNEDVAVIGEKLNVATLLDGSVRKAGNRVRISVQLVQASDRVPALVRDRTIARSTTSSPCQDDIAQSVVKELRTTLLGDAIGFGRARSAHATSPVAPRGTARIRRRIACICRANTSSSDCRRRTRVKGLRFLNDAVALDPSHAAAWTEIGRAYTNLGGYGWQTPAVAFRQARDAVQARAGDRARHRPSVRTARHDPAQLRLGLEGRGGIDTPRGRAGTRQRRSFARARRACARAQPPGGAEGYLHRGDRAGPVARGRPFRARPGVSIDGSRRRCRAVLLEGDRARAAAHQHALRTRHRDREEGRDAEAMALINQEPAEWGRLTALALAHHLAGRKAESDVRSRS